MQISEYIKNIIKKLKKNGYEAFIVGGCVRDLLMGREVNDWDITTNAKPEEILKVFPGGKYENVFGTVILPIKNEKNENIDAVEITTYRSEQGYSDRRHPDKIKFEDNLEKDLTRRDFTINAMAIKQLESRPALPAAAGSLAEHACEKIINNEKYILVDLFGGEKDIKEKIIRAVGEPADRFKEDALRMMRAIRISSQLDFKIEPKTERGIIKLAGSIKFISKERIKDELIKILKSERAYEGIMKLHELKLLQYIIPELELGVGMKQKGHHIYSVFNHSMLSLKFCPNKDWRVRLASLLHDIAKPKTLKVINGENTFYNHDYIGAKIVRKIMERLKFSREDTEKVYTLILNHMFYYNVDEVTAASVRRLIVKTGEENLSDLIDLRIADRLGSGVKKAIPYKLRHLKYMIDKVRKDPISVKMLKINGNDLMQILKIKPSPKIGAILDVLLSEIIEDSKLNNKKHLEKRSFELNKMDLLDLRKKAKEIIEEKKEENDQAIKKKYWVK